MDFMGLIKAVIEFFQANWNVIEPLARRLAEDLAALWVLGLALAEVIKKFFPASTVGTRMSNSLTGVFKK